MGQEIAFLAAIDTPAPPLDSESTVSPTTLNKLLGGISRCLQQLSQLQFKGQLNYLWDRIYWNLTVGKLNTPYRLYMRYIKRSPAEVRLLDMNRVITKAKNEYVGSIYPGSLTLIHVKENYSKLEQRDLGWSKLALEGVEIYEVNGSHTTIMREPEVKYVAEHLLSSLQKNRDKSSTNMILDCP